MSSCWLPIFSVPSDPTAPPLVNFSSPLSTASAAADISVSSETSLAAIFDGSAWTMICLLRKPQVATLATPGTAISLGRMVYCAIIDRSIGETAVDVSPICTTRLVADTMGYICGKSHQLGSVCDRLQPLLHELAGVQLIGAAAEVQPDRRQ